MVPVQPVADQSRRAVVSDLAAAAKEAAGSEVGFRLYFAYQRDFDAASDSLGMNHSRKHYILWVSA